MAALAPRYVLRYHLVQRLLHWMGAAGFVLLLLTGSVLVWTPHIPIGICCATRQLHRVGAILYALWPILYAILNPAGLREMVKESLTFTRDDIAWFKYALPYFFGRTRHAPPQGRINAGQKLHHLGVIVFSLLIGVTGLVMWLGAGRLGAANLAIAATIHDLCMLALTVLMVGHIYFTFLYGGLGAMLQGYVSEEYALMEHPKWLATLPENAFITATHKPVSLAVSKGAQPTSKPDVATEPLVEAHITADQSVQKSLQDELSGQRSR